MKKYIQLVSIVALALVLTACSFRPDIKLEDIQRDINGKDTGEGLLSWRFQPEEPKTMSILETSNDGKRRTIVIDMVTESKPQMFSGIDKRAGKLRLHYEWIADQWNLVRVENLTFRKI